MNPVVGYKRIPGNQSKAKRVNNSNAPPLTNAAAAATPTMAKP